MFEQTFVEFKEGGKKSYPVLLSLMLQVTALTVLIVAPLIYTQVLPKAQLRSVFAAPIPPPAALPKAPTTVRTGQSHPVFQLTLITPVVTRPRDEVAEVAAPPVFADDGREGEVYSIGEPAALPSVKPPEPPKAAIQPKPAGKPIRIASMEASQLIHKVQPAYPSLAKQVHVQGIVEFTATISRDGNIEHLQLVRGHPMLVLAAEEAILQWKYKPTLLNGEPVEVITDIIVNFTLTQ